MKLVGRIILIVLIAGTFIGTLYFLYQKGAKKEVVYETVQPEKGDILKKTVATGSVIPRKEILLKPQVSGIVEEIVVVPGQKVKKGDLICRIRIVPNMVNLNNAENRLNQARIANENAKIDFERNETLYKQKVIAYAEFQRFENALKNSKEELSAATDNLDIIKDGVSKKIGAQSLTLVRSTSDGMVLDVPVEEGNAVIESNTFNEGTTIATVANMSDMIFQGMLDESEVGKVKTGMQMILTIGALENQTFDAQIEYIAPKGIEENGAIQFEIKAALSPSEKNASIRAGYSANASIVLEKKTNVLHINEALLQFEGEKRFVEVEKAPQVFEKRYVTTGLSDGIKVEILSGITAADKLKVPSKNL